MKQQPSFRDIKKLSAYLDDQLSRSDRVRLEARLESEAPMREILVELRQARALLKRTPKVRIPHNFTLTLKMAGIRPPLPRSVPLFRLASITAAILLFISFGLNFLTPITAAPSMAAAPYGMGGGGCDPNVSGQCQEVAPQADYGKGGGPVDTAAPAEGTPMTFAAMAPGTPTPEPTPDPNLRTMEQPSQVANVAPTEIAALETLPTEISPLEALPNNAKIEQTEPNLYNLQIGLIVLFLLFGSMALLIHQLNILKWRKRQ